MCFNCWRVFTGKFTSQQMQRQCDRMCSGYSEIFLTDTYRQSLQIWRKKLNFLSQFCAHLHRLVNNVHGKYMVCNVQAKARCKIGSRGKLHQEWKKGHGQDAWDAWCMFCWERGRFFLLCHMQCTQMNVRAKHELLLSVVFWDANTILYPV